MKDWAIGFLLFVSVVVIGIIAAPRIGASWDEPDNIHAGGIYAKFFTRGLDPTILTDRNAIASVWYDKIFTQEPSLSRYPPVPLFVGVIVVKIWEILKGSAATAQEIIYGFHIASSMFMGVFVATMYVLMRKLGIPRISAVVATILAGMHPTIFGYGMSDIKDSALLALFTLSLTLLIKGTLDQKIRYLLMGAVVWGLALATKINAIYVPVIWLAWKIGYEILREMGGIRGIGGKLKQLGKILVRSVTQGAVLGAVGLVVMVVVWPYLWFDPVGRILEVLRYFTTVGTGYKVFWNQELYMVGAGKALPWYPLVHTLVGTPLTYLALAVVGGVGLIFWAIFGKKNIDLVQDDSPSHENSEDSTSAFLKLWRRITKKLFHLNPTQDIFRKRDVVSVLILIIIWVSVPLIRTLSATASFYDGMRHFLEVLPPIFLLMAFGFEAIKHLLHKVSPTKGNKLAGIVMIVTLTHIIFVNIHLFPYQTGYVNALAHNPNTTLERDFGGLAMREGVELAHKLRSGSLSVFAPIAGHLSWYWLQGGDLYVYSQAQADAVILINKSSHVSKIQLDALISGEFDLKGVVRRGRDEFAWVYLRK